MNFELKIKSWNDISINMYKQIVEISKEEGSTAVEKDIAVIALFCGVDEEEIYNTNISELQRLKNEIDWLSNMPQSPDIKHTKNIKIGKYNCDLLADISDMTVAQYIDFQNYFLKANDNLAQALSVFVIPQGCKYNDGYDVADLINEIDNNLSYLIANAFFLAIQKMLEDSMKTTLISLDKEMKKLTKDKIGKTQKEKINQARIYLKRVIDSISTAG